MTSIAPFKQTYRSHHRDGRSRGVTGLLPIGSAAVTLSASNCSLDMQWLFLTSVALFSVGSAVYVLNMKLCPT
ncbi:hypothetical protein HDV63DRAFT_389631 [Trichoderma sp. SZMC 28014]